LKIKYPRIYVKNFFKVMGKTVPTPEEGHNGRGASAVRDDNASGKKCSRDHGGLARQSADYLAIGGEGLNQSAAGGLMAGATRFDA
jgi:hypothetical protein